MKMLTHPKSTVLAFALAFGMTGFALPAQSNANPNTNSQNSSQAQNSQSGSYSQAEVRSAQQKLKDDGDYTGRIDGVDGPMTRAAIRKYQRNQNLTVNGRLDQQTRDKLGVQQQ